jgi:hypothetical protein
MRKDRHAAQAASLNAKDEAEEVRRRAAGRREQPPNTGARNVKTMAEVTAAQGGTVPTLAEASSDAPVEPGDAP